MDQKNKKPSKWEWDEFTRGGTCEVCHCTGTDMSLCQITAGTYRHKWVGLGCRRRLEKDPSTKFSDAS